MESAMLQKLAFGVALSAGLVATAYAQAVQEDTLMGAIANLNWQIGANTYTLPFANSVIDTQDDEGFLLGDDADELLRLLEGHSELDVDALVMKIDGPLADSYVTYSYEETGYVKMND
jgi:hypothetical protein